MTHQRLAIEVTERLVYWGCGVCAEAARRGERRAKYARCESCKQSGSCEAEHLEGMEKDGES